MERTVLASCFFSRKKKNVQKELKKIEGKNIPKGGSLFLQDVNAEFKFEKPVLNNADEEMALHPVGDRTGRLFQ